MILVSLLSITITLFVVPSHGFTTRGLSSCEVLHSRTPDRNVKLNTRRKSELTRGHFVHVVAASTSVTPSTTKHTWKVFVDLQCPFAKKCMARLPKIKERFQDKYDFSVHLTDLAFHPQAFPGHCAAYLLGVTKGPEARNRFVNECFKYQDTYSNNALGDARKSDVYNLFADIAEEAGVLNDEDGLLTREEFLEGMTDWEKVIKPTWEEHKVALRYGVFGTPRHVIDEKLVADTESTWGPDEWEEALKQQVSEIVHH